jgi:hypothetical protein
MLEVHYLKQAGVSPFDSVIDFPINVELKQKYARVYVLLMSQGAFCPAFPAYKQDVILYVSASVTYISFQ